MYKAPDIRCCALQRIPRIHFHNLGVSLISAPQQVSEIYTTVCPFNFTHFIVKLRAGRRIIPGSYVISILTFSFSFFFFCPWTCFHGSVWVPDDPDLKSLFSCCHGSTLTSFKMWGKLHCSKLEKTAPSISARSGVTAKVLINFTSSVASATNTNCCEIFSSRVMEGGKRLAVSLRIIIRINPFTHLSLGTREGPKTCQAITQLHRSVHKIFHLTLAVICTH